MADDQGRESPEALVEPDADLARQQETIGIRRNRPAALPAEADSHPNSTTSPEMEAAMVANLDSGSRSHGPAMHRLGGERGRQAAAQHEVHRGFTRPRCPGQS
ncbi:hypothetical protein GCM10022224_055040 [Nonomuraea antimicrobica]|uniref:Uncharacterized protein n=1 Tax=Nonomuraea antimicrobica TaxID=561173 RepID=A0ABP7CB81_9ACTN